jgi:phosphoribosylanthranilate isomerase
VFYDKSPRHVEVETALEIVNALPPFINRVGLFVNADSSFIDEVLCEVPLDTLQFHGDEAPIECSQYAMPFIKALRVHQDTNLIKPTRLINGGSALTISRAVSTSTWRGDLS